MEVKDLELLFQSFIELTKSTPMLAVLFNMQKLDLLYYKVDFSFVFQAEV